MRRRPTKAKGKKGKAKGRPGGGGPGGRQLASPSLPAVRPDLADPFTPGGMVGVPPLPRPLRKGLPTAIPGQLPPNSPFGRPTGR